MSGAVQLLLETLRAPLIKLGNHFFSSFFFEANIILKLVRLIKVCLSEQEIRIGRYLSHTFPNQNGLKRIPYRNFLLTVFRICH
jgi:hypothetical protein